MMEDDRARNPCIREDAAERGGRKRNSNQLEQPNGRTSNLQIGRLSVNLQRSTGLRAGMHLRHRKYA
jgi:hypothetical protein